MAGTHLVNDTFLNMYSSKQRGLNLTLPTVLSFLRLSLQMVGEEHLIDNMISSDSGGCGVPVLSDLISLLDNQNRLK